MKVDSHKVFSEFHERRKTEHFTMWYYITEKYLSVSLIQFAREYKRWKEANSVAEYVITTDEYLEWLSSMIDNAIGPCMSMWEQIRYPIAHEISSPLAVSIGIYSSVYPESIDTLAVLTGFSTKSIKAWKEKCGNALPLNSRSCATKLNGVGMK